MSNPTRYNAWTFPQPEDDPWYEGFERLWQQIDNTCAFAVVVNSLVEAQVSRVETASLPFGTCLVSFYPTSETAFTFSSGLSNATWYTLSAHPFGAAVGCFTLIGSASSLYWTLDTGAYAFVDLSGTAKLIEKPLRIYPRVVLVGGLPGSVPNTYTVGDSVWQYVNNVHGNHFRWHFEAITSCGPGRWSAEIQLRGTVESGQPYVLAMDRRDFATLTVEQGLTGNQ